MRNIFSFGFSHIYIPAVNSAPTWIGYCIITCKTQKMRKNTYIVSRQFTIHIHVSLQNLQQLPSSHQTLTHLTTALFFSPVLLSEKKIELQIFSGRKTRNPYQTPLEVCKCSEML